MIAVLVNNIGLNAQFIDQNTVNNQRNIKDLQAKNQSEAFFRMIDSNDKAQLEKFVRDNPFSKVWSKTGENLLGYAITKKRVPMIDLLIKYCDNVNALDKNKKTPLFYATMLNDCRSVKKLLESGARPQDTLERDAAPIAVAVWNANYRNAALLLEYGADSNSIYNDGRSLLYVAIEHSWLAGVRLLIEYGADIEQQNQGRTPLELANSGISQKVIGLFIMRKLHEQSKLEILYP